MQTKDKRVMLPSITQPSSGGKTTASTVRSRRSQDATGSLVFLKEDGLRTKHPWMMEKAGLVKLRGGGGEQHELPQHQADYLTKLARLRDQLIHQEKNNLDVALDRYQQQTFYREQKQQQAIKRGNSKPSGPQPFPERHKRLQAEIKERIANRRRPKSPPLLDMVSGQPLIDPVYDTRPSPALKVSTTRRGDSSVRSTTESLTDTVALERARIAHMTTTNLKPQSSIPNIGRKAVRPQDKLMLPVSDRAGSESFVKQVPVHEKDSLRGVYKAFTKHPGKKHFLRGDSDMIDLSPETFQLDVAGYAPNSDDEDNGGQLNSSSKLKQNGAYSRRSRKNGSIHSRGAIDPEMAPFQVPADQFVKMPTMDQSAGDKAPNPSPVNPSSPTSLTPSQSSSNSKFIYQVKVHERPNNYKGSSRMFETPREDDPHANRRHLVVDMPGGALFPSIDGHDEEEQDGSWHVNKNRLNTTGSDKSAYSNKTYNDNHIGMSAEDVRE